MKNYFLPVVFFIFSLQVSSLSTSLLEQSFEKKPTKGLSLSPIQLLLLSLDGKFAYKLNHTMVLTVPFVLQYLPTLSFREIFYINAGLGAQFFLSGKALQEGFYIEPSVSLGYSQATPRGLASLHSIFLRETALIGYQWVLNSGISLNIAAGAIFNYAFSDEAPVYKKALPPEFASITPYFGLTRGFNPTAELSIGYYW